MSVDSDFLQNCAIVNSRSIFGNVRFNLSERVDGLVSSDNFGVQALTTALFCTRTQALSCWVSYVAEADNESELPARKYTSQVIQYASPTTVIDGMACIRDRVVVLPVLAV